MDKQLTLDELKEMHGKPVWCRIPSDNPRWGIVDAESSCVVLGANHRLIFYHYGEWKAFTSPDPTPSPTIKPGNTRDAEKILDGVLREIDKLKLYDSNPKAFKRISDIINEDVSHD